MSQYHSLAIRRAEPETDAALCLTFDVPESLREDYRFTPGQCRSSTRVA